MPNLLIAIDGYSSTGKGTFAKAIASKLGVLYLDSGAIYRAVTLYSLENGIIEWNGDIKFRTLQEHITRGLINVSFARTKNGEDRIFLGDKNVSSRIRDLDVASNVSPVSAIPFVRNFVDDQLHRLATNGGVVDGRDIGTAVFPNADLKIFMTADAHIRAQRRLKQMEESGTEATFEQILKNVQDRDYADSHRSFHPLTQAPDAIVLDNSHMTVEEQMVWLDAILQERFNVSLL